MRKYFVTKHTALGGSSIVAVPHAPLVKGDWCEEAWQQYKDSLEEETEDDSI